MAICDLSISIVKDGESLQLILKNSTKRGILALLSNAKLFWGQDKIKFAPPRFKRCVRILHILFLKLQLQESEVAPLAFRRHLMRTVYCSCILTV
jgi:hypothetical protein